MAAFATAYAPDGAPPLLVDCLTIADPSPYRSQPAVRLRIGRYGIVTAAGGWSAARESNRVRRAAAGPDPAATRRTVGVSPSRVAGAAPACAAAERAVRPAHRSCSGTVRPGSASPRLAS